MTSVYCSQYNYVIKSICLLFMWGQSCWPYIHLTTFLCLMSRSNKSFPSFVSASFFKALMNLMTLELLCLVAVTIALSLCSSLIVSRDPPWRTSKAKHFTLSRKQAAFTGVKPCFEHLKKNGREETLYWYALSIMNVYRRLSHLFGFAPSLRRNFTHLRRSASDAWKRAASPAQLAASTWTPLFRHCLILSILPLDA